MTAIVWCIDEGLGAGWRVGSHIYSDRPLSLAIRYPGDPLTVLFLCIRTTETLIGLGLDLCARSLLVLSCFLFKIMDHKVLTQ